MKILRLRKEEISLFDWLDPFGLLAGLELPNRFALAAAALQEDWSDVPAGLLIASLEEERMVIEWLCVDPERRNKGIGKALIRHLSGIENKERIGGIGVRLRFNARMGAFSGAAEEYFRKQGFLRELKLPGEWRINISDMLSLPFFFREDRKNPETLPASALGEARLEALIRALREKKETHELYALSRFPLFYDMRCSKVLMNGNEVRGLFLVIRAGDALYPVFFHAESERDGWSLIRAAVREFAGTTGADSRIEVIAADEETAELVSQLKKAEKTEVRLLVR